MITRDEYLQALEIVSKYRKQVEDDLKKSEYLIKSYSSDYLLEDVAMSSRLKSYFKAAELIGYGKKTTIQDLKNLANEKGFSHFARCPRFGKKSLQELKLIINSIK